MQHNQKNLVLSPPVEEALKTARPVVALESTIITHGMPYPQNLETAQAVEQMVRNTGATPATIAVLNGKIHIGMEADQLESLARGENVMKLSRADFAFAVAQEKTGSTTVAATMMAAQMAGIAVFATGGIGGVHRGADQSFDISADLKELAETDVIVVCAGAKAILDLEKTLEVLETNGVPVFTYGSDELPAFWSRKSGLSSPLRLDSAAAVADHTRTRKAMNIKGGVLIANPVPKKDEIPQIEIAKYIEAALLEAEKNGVTGKQVTPYLLGKMFDLTGGKSLKTNIALILNNARLAAEIAVALSSR